MAEPEFSQDEEYYDDELEREIIRNPPPLNLPFGWEGDPNNVVDEDYP